MDLNEIRNQIDQIDDQLVQLFCQRMNLSAHVADYKKANNLPILVPARERAILQKVAEKAVKDYDKLGKVQKEKKIEKINEKIRETAHFVEFIPLGLLIFLLIS